MSPLPQNIQDLLTATDRRRRQFAVIRNALLVVCIVLLAGLAVVVIDWLASPEDSLRRMLSWSLWGVVVLLLFAYVLLPWLRRESGVRTARRIEAHLPDNNHERLSAAVALSEQAPNQEQPSWMVQRTVALASQEVAEVRPEAVIPHRPLRRYGYGLLLCALPLLIGLCFADGRAWWGRALLPWADILRPSEFRVVVDGEHQRQVLRGQDVAIAVAVHPQREAAHAQVQWADGRRQNLPLDRQPGEDDATYFRLTLRGVMDDAQVRFTAGDGRSHPVAITVVDPPRVVEQQWIIQPPAYSGMSERRQAADDMELLLGSQIAMQVHTRGPGINALHLLADDQRHALKPAEEGVWTLPAWQPEADARLRMVIIDEHGHEQGVAGPWRLRLREDAPPQLEVQLAGHEQGLAADETVLLQLRADDDVGLEAVSLQVHDGSLTRRHAMTVAAPHRGPWREQWALDLSRYDVQPGQSLELTLVGRDIGGQEASSSPLTVRIEARDLLRERRRSARLRQLHASFLEAQQDLRRVHAELGSLIVGVSEADVAEVFLAELRQGERRIQRTSQRMQELVQQWPTPRGDALGRAEAGLRGRVDTWQQVYASQLQNLSRALREDGSLPELLR
ncbi:MAG: hypothetical protein EA401_04370, partial [Planctomycetota bacterium]